MEKSIGCLVGRQCPAAGESGGASGIAINVAQRLKEPIGAPRRVDIDDVVGREEGTIQVWGKLEFVRTDQGILVEGFLDAKSKTTCSRCLSVFDCQLSFRIEEEYFPTVDVVSGVSLPSPGEPGVFTIDANHILDLSEAARQYTLLTMPLKPLCQPDCAGLCPSCGHNLNEGKCSCPPSGHDPRWWKLEKEFFKKG